MKRITLILILFFQLFILNSCSENEERTQNQSTNLELTIRDELGNSIDNVSVKLFSSEADLNNRTNQIGTTLLTDINGKVIFENLSTINYFWIAEKECKNNLNDIFSNESVLISNSNNPTPVTISDSNTGTLEITNTTNTTRHIEIITSGIQFDLTPNTTKFLYDVPVGECLIQVYYENFMSTVTAATINCGETLRHSF